MNQLTIATHEAKLALWAERIQECHESGMSVKEVYQIKFIIIGFEN